MLYKILKRKPDDIFEEDKYELVPYFYENASMFIGEEFIKLFDEYIGLDKIDESGASYLLYLNGFSLTIWDKTTKIRLYEVTDDAVKLLCEKEVSHSDEIAREILMIEIHAMENILDSITERKGALQ